MLFRLVGQRLTEQWLERLAASERVPKEHLVVTEQARSQSPVRREPHAIARRTVGVRHGRDDADAARRARESVVLGGAVTARRPTVRREGSELGDSREHLVARYYVFPREPAHLADRHQL